MAIERSKGRMLIFAGTSEGHLMARYLRDRKLLDKALFSVATEYGEETLSDIEGAEVITGRLDRSGIEKLIAEEGFRLVIDATHPYADKATAEIKAAADACGIEYVRVLREEKLPLMPGVLMADTAADAAKMLNDVEGRFLLTTGAKELGVFSSVRDFAERAIVRVLPSAASLDACFQAGVRPASVIAMQGPFTKEMNLATMRQYDLKTIVTKSSGGPGGFLDKAALADDGFTVIVIGRPATEAGVSLAEAEKRMAEIYG